MLVKSTKLWLAEFKIFRAWGNLCMSQPIEHSKVYLLDVFLVTFEYESANRKFVYFFPKESNPRRRWLWFLKRQPFLCQNRPQRFKLTDKLFLWIIQFRLVLVFDRVIRKISFIFWIVDDVLIFFAIYIMEFANVLDSCFLVSLLCEVECLSILNDSICLVLILGVFDKVLHYFMFQRFKSLH